MRKSGGGKAILHALSLLRACSFWPPHLRPFAVASSHFGRRIFTLSASQLCILVIGHRGETVKVQMTPFGFPHVPKRLTSINGNFLEVRTRY